MNARAHTHVWVHGRDEYERLLTFLNSCRPCAVGRETEFEAEMITEGGRVRFCDSLMGIQQWFQVEIKVHGVSVYFIYRTNGCVKLAYARLCHCNK